MIQDNERRDPLISDDLTTNANADVESGNIRSTNDLVLSKYNVDEKFIVAKFSSVKDLERAYDAVVEYGYPKDQIVLAIVGKKEDEFFNSVKALENAFEKEDRAHYQYVSMGLEAASPEMASYVADIWDRNNAVSMNA